MVNKKAVKIVSAVVAASVSVGSVTTHNCGSSKEIDLQSPSLIGPNAVTFDDFCSPAYEEAENTAYVPMSLKNAKFNIDDYTIVAVKSYSDIAAEFGTDPLDPITYDGSMYWINGDAVLVAPKSENAEGEEDSEDSEETEDDEDQNQDDVISLKLNDTVTRIAYIKDWSLVRLPDGREGYIMNSHLSAEEIVEEPETTDEPEDVSYDDDDDDGSSYTEPDPEPYSEPDPEPETSSEPDWEEWDVDYTVYASTALNTRTGPGISYTLLSTLSTGSEIEVVAETDNGWYKSADGYYVKASFTQEDEPYIPEPVYYDDDDDDDDYYDSEDWSSFASYVRGFIGCRYVYGGASPDGFDCSGFVMYCYETYYGIYLPHGATSQSYCGEWVDPDDIQVGDIICFDKEGDGIMEHAGLYVGNDTYVHAQSSATGVVESCYSSAKWKIGSVRRVL